MRHRSIGIITAAGLAVAGMLSIAPAGTAVTAGPAVSARVAVARPFAIRLGDFHWAQPPSTGQCVKTTGFACYRPSQFQQAYDLKPLYARHLNGRGRTIILVTRSARRRSSATWPPLTGRSTCRRRRGSGCCSR